MSKTSRFLGIDYGKRRVWVARSSEGIAFASVVLSQSEAIERIARIVAEDAIDQIVVGLPVRLDGSESETTHAVRSFAGRLGGRIPEIRIIFWDERLSSAEAESVLREAGRSGESDDAIAAAIILQNYLDSL